MRCTLCSARAVVLEPALCSAHFSSRFEKKVAKTITKYKMFTKRERIIVAASGGKDSLALLFILKRQGYNVSALAVDEGISGYRPLKLRALEAHCSKEGIGLDIVSFKEQYGITLDEAVKKTRTIPCTVCGILRRDILNKHAQEYDVLATGHNMDDEAQAVLMNIFKNDLSILARTGPVSGIMPKDRFIKRVKPFYLCSEKETMVYSYVNSLYTPFVECPYVVRSFRAEIRDSLNEYECRHKGTKESVLDSFLSFSSQLKEATEQNLGLCRKCGAPCAGEICNSCQIVKRLGDPLVC